jgi:hypothetical protein
MVKNNNDVQNQDHSLDPYFVHPSKNSTIVSAMPQLTGDNYHSWSMKMRRELAMKNKFKFVDGSIHVHDEDVHDTILIFRWYQSKFVLLYFRFVKIEQSFRCSCPSSDLLSFRFCS